jgi:two-component system cell cycle sensor histidine kinase/response regulator CckA
MRGDSEQSGAASRGRLRRWLGWLAPRPQADEELARVAGVVHVLGLAMSVALLPAIAHNLAAGHRWAVVALLVQEGLTLVCLLLNRWGAVRSASRLMALSVVGLAATLQLVSRQGVHDVSVLIYPAAILVGGALFQRRWYVLYTLLVMAMLALQYALELSGVVRYELSPHVELRLLIDSEIILAVSALGVGVLMGNLRRSMARAAAAAAAARESEELYRSFFESVNEGIFVHDALDGHICDANARAAQLSGYTVEELCSLSVGEMSSNVDGFTGAEAMRRVALAAQGRPQLFEWQSRRRDGRVLWTEVSARAALVRGQPRIIVSVRDIDERKRAEAERQRLEDQLRQAQKLESIGRLAGGIAHDFNNLLTCVLGNVDLGLTVTAAGHPVRENLEEIGQAGRRAAELTSQLLAFSRKQPIAPIALDVGNVLGSTDRMLRRLLGETITVVTRVAPDVGRIRVDPGQVEQVIVNLAVNARDAMPDGGRLDITAENQDTDEAFVVAHPGTRAGQFVRLSIVDTGCGMSEEVQRRAFEPFFTTKPAGQGTGLGLAMVAGAMEQNSGFAVLTSRRDHGSRFDLFFPRFSGEAVPLKTVPEPTPLPGGSERVLLVEDDPSIRQFSERVLARLGYQVTACATGAEAIALRQASETSFDLLVTDLILPDLDGRTLVQQLVARQPTLRVLYCSGYSEDVIAHGGVLEEGVAFLAKPFNVETLASKVRAVLDEPPGSSSA